MDAFYASVEQRDRPELKGSPVIVGATSARGVVAAASYEARAYGVRSAMPAFQARQLCPHGVYLPANIARYAEVSRAVHDVFEEFSPEIEPLALDEAFLDITASIGLFGGPRGVAERLKARVREQVDLVVSVGVAPNKLVAKIACALSKPDGLLVVCPHEVRPLLDPLPVRRLWGVGPVLARKLHRIGVTTIGELAACGEERLARAAGERAQSLKLLALGVDSRPVEAERAPKSCGEENTFERDVTDRTLITAVVTSHSEAVARRLRADGYRGRTITLKVKLARRASHRESRIDSMSDEPVYPERSMRHTLERATNDGAVIRAEAVRLFDALALREPIRLLGVSVSNLEREEPAQLELFAESSSSQLGATLDSITARFGAGAIRRAADDPGKLTPSLRKKRW
jgi:DNA polymerase-4